MKLPKQSKYNKKIISNKHLKWCRYCALKTCVTSRLFYIFNQLRNVTRLYFMFTWKRKICDKLIIFFQKNTLFIILIVTAQFPSRNNKEQTKIHTNFEQKYLSFPIFYLFWHNFQTRWVFTPWVISVCQFQ